MMRRWRSPYPNAPPFPLTTTRPGLTCRLFLNPHAKWAETLGIAEFPILGCIRNSRVGVKDTIISSRVLRSI
ncbi:hypothetical protein ACJW31_09G139700 [Castanea mollissima]